MLLTRYHLDCQVSARKQSEPVLLEVNEKSTFRRLVSVFINDWDFFPVSHIVACFILR